MSTPPPPPSLPSPPYFIPAASPRLTISGRARIATDRGFRNDLGNGARAEGGGEGLRRDQPSVRVRRPQGFPRDLRGFDQGGGQVTLVLSRAKRTALIYSTA